MQSYTIIKLLHRILTLTLLTIVIGYLAYQKYYYAAPDDDFYSTQKISEKIWLYITKYKGGGATVSDVYRYYLDGELGNTPLKHLAGREPFLIADVGDAQVTGQGNQVNVTVNGRVYSFTNSAAFYVGDEAVMPVINFVANRVR
ncbi:hypothetical protein ACOXVJ_16755 [Pseudomonas knackmussii]|uniref:hypothetical protein n=1 Tax=Pseudomonas knackmussii TaxID=65741 RepID=UPI003BC544F5